jgi:hypothetical protein
MTYLKRLGVVAVAALAAMAIVGAGTASATVICKNNLNTEHCSEPYEKGAKGVASLTQSAILETTGGVTLDTCTGSTVESTLADPGSSTTTVKSGISTITWAGCTGTTDTLSGGTAELHWISGTNNGTLTTIGTEVTVQTLGVSCIYGSGTATDVGTTVGGNPGHLTVSAGFPKIGGSFVCPSTVVFTGEYVATSPKNAWVTKD